MCGLFNHYIICDVNTQKISTKSISVNLAEK